MKKFALVILDIVSLYGALALTLFIRYRDNFALHQHQHIVPFSIIFTLWILILYIFNLYEWRTLRNNLYFYSSLITTNLIAGGVSIIFFYLIPIFGITPKTNLFLFITIFTGLSLATRSLFNNIVGKNFKRSLLIIGANPQSIELAKFVRDNPQFAYHLVYLVTTQEGSPELHDLPVLANIQDIKEIIATQDIDTIVISPEAYQIPAVINLLYGHLDHKITFSNLASFYEHLTSRVPLGAINQIWFLENLTEGTKNTYGIVKRVADIVLSIFMGTGFLVLLPFIALAIKLNSPGPIFYRQRRFGQGGKIFEIVKLRSMQINAEADGAVWASDNDPRITSIGKFLRKSRLDELPQLWNILKGEMSFVGPRAERPEFHDTLKREIPFYEERYLVKPGLTGWAQINYRYGSSINDAAEKLQYDLYYIKHRSILLDIGTILRTINISLRQAGR